MLDVILLNVIMPNVIMPNVIMPNCISLSVFTLKVVVRNVFMLDIILQCHCDKWHYTECRGASKRAIPLIWSKFWEIFDDINKEVDKDGATTFSIMTLCITTISKMTLVLLCLCMLSVAFLLL
jgi:hypothetical protein